MNAHDRPSPGHADEAPSSGAGRIVQGRYRIGRLLGEGGMGAVYEAEHLEIGKRVAIKIVHALHARDPQVTARIRQEARSTGAIESENIVAVFDAGNDEELGIYLVMELLKGGDLGSLLSGGRRVSPVAAATMVLQATKGLSCAHAKGIVHRDLKPANVFLATRDDGSSIVKLVDFGIAKLVRDASRVGAGLTQAGLAIGTPRYMSPEQAQGLATVDHRTDVYSLGAVLFEAVAGVPPFHELPTYEQTIVRLVTTSAPRLSSVVPDVDPRLDQLCADMMAHDPGARPADMGAVRERLCHIYPDVERGHLRVSVRDGEAHLDAALAPRSQSVPPTGGGWVARSDRPASGESLSIPITYEEPESPSPAPPRRRRKRGPYLVAVGTVVLSSLLCMVALFKAYRAHTSAPPPVTYGVALPVAAATPPGELKPQSPESVAPAPAAPPPEAAPSAAPAATETETTPSKPALPAAKSRPPRRRPAPKRLIGGTTESTEF